MTKSVLSEKLKLALALVASLAVATSASAATDSDETAGESTVKVEELDKPAKDLDEEITNARMRASSGSKSKYSLSLSTAYQGGSVVRPFGQRRPDLYGDPDAEATAYLSGSFAGRYRMTANDSLKVGGAYVVFAPIQDGTENTDVSNPYIAYNRTAAIGDWQTSFDADVTFTTRESSRAINMSNIVSLGYTALTTLKSIPLTMGLASSLGWYVYDADPGLAGTDRAADTTQWSLGLYPFMEYAFNDTFQFRTVFGYFRWFNPYYAEDDFAMINEEPYQSVGLGIVASRNVYIYPNVQFLPAEFDAETTNVGISATINAF